LRLATVRKAARLCEPPLNVLSHVPQVPKITAGCPSRKAAGGAPVEFPARRRGREIRMNAPLTLTPRSSLGSKFLMALTGLGLTGFVIAHMIGNFQVFLGRDALNSYAAALKHMPGLLWTARIGLLAIFVLHIAYGVKLWRANRAARPILYHFKKYREATFASRTMIWTGLVILAFVLFHLAHYTFGIVSKAAVPDPRTGVLESVNYHDLKDPTDPMRQDVYAMTIYGFRNPIISLLYIASMAFLAFHLSHGFQSLFQSLGLNHPRWAPLLQGASLVVAGAIFVGNSSMPLAVLFRLVGGNEP
jgi:succinate dehydrogenase / fumarate reductase cytochrome b subunit